MPREYTPADTYDTLLLQYKAMVRLLHIQEGIVSFYQKKDYNSSEHRLKYLEEQLESERAMNARLTEEIEQLTYELKEER